MYNYNLLCWWIKWKQKLLHGVYNFTTSFESYASFLNVNPISTINGSIHLQINTFIINIHYSLTEHGDRICVVNTNGKWLAAMRLNQEKRLTGAHIGFHWSVFCILITKLSNFDNNVSWWIKINAYVNDVLKQSLKLVCAKFELKSLYRFFLIFLINWNLHLCLKGLLNS